MAQLIHAAGESSPGNLPENTHAVALYAKDEEELLALAKRLEDAKIAHRLIREPDAPYNGAAMAIGLVPCARTTPVKKILGRYPLVK